MPVEPLHGDELLERLDRLAADTIAIRGLVTPLAGPNFDALRRLNDLTLLEIGRCIARELGAARDPDADPSQGMGRTGGDDGRGGTSGRESRAG